MTGGKRRRRSSIFARTAVVVALVGALGLIISEAIKTRTGSDRPSNDRSITSSGSTQAQQHASGANSRNVVANHSAVGNQTILGNSNVMSSSDHSVNIAHVSVLNMFIVDWSTIAAETPGELQWSVTKKAGKHPTVQAVANIRGKKVVVIPVKATQGGSDTRITDNIDFDPVWQQPVGATIYLANVPAGKDPHEMTFRQKFDASFKTDPSIGPELTHGTHLLLDVGHERYFAKRSSTIYPGSFIVIVQDGLALSDINRLPGMRVEQPTNEIAQR
jgi:hypothetical protein